MEIEVADFVAGARQARGIVVIIDVFRAFSTACYCFMQGAERLLPAGAVEEALALKARHPEALLVGERHGRKLEGFDFGNSPSEMLAADIRGRTLIHSTHAGTQGLVNAERAEEVLTGSLVNAQATADYILARRPAVVTLVRMGLEATQVSDEDALCAMYLAGLLKGHRHHPQVLTGLLTDSPFAERFFDPARPDSPEEDFHLCLRFDEFRQAIRADWNAEGELELRPVWPT